MSLRKNTIIYALGNSFPSIINFILLPIYARYLKTEGFGLVTSIQLLEPILLILYTLAVDRAIYRLYFDYKTEAERKKYLGSVTLFIYVYSLIIVILLLLFNHQVCKIYKSIPFYPYYLFGLLSAFLSIFSIVPKIYFQVSGKSLKYILFTISQFVVTTVFTIWFLIGKNEGAIGMLKGPLVGCLVYLPFCIFINWKIAKINFDLSILKKSLTFSLPLIPGLLSGWVVNQTNRIFIERYFSLHDVGVYSLSYKIASLVLLVSSAIGMSYNPVFFNITNNKSREQASKQLRKYNTLLVLISFFMAFFVAFFSKEIILLLFSKDFSNAGNIIPLILIGIFISQAMSPLSLSVMQMKKNTQGMYITLSTSIINIVLNYVLIPKFGMYGAAYASILSFGFCYGGYYILAKKYYYIPLNLRILVPVFIVCIVLMAISSRLQNYNVIILLVIKIFAILLSTIVLYKVVFKKEIGNFTLGSIMFWK